MVSNTVKQLLVLKSRRINNVEEFEKVLKRGLFEAQHHIFQAQHFLEAQHFYKL
jgi:hypothetical protein